MMFRHALRQFSTSHPPATATITSLVTAMPSAEDRAQRVLSGVLSTLMTNIPTDPVVAKKYQQLHPGTVTLNSLVDGDNSLLVKSLHSAPTLQKLYDEILKVDKSYSGWVTKGFTLDLLKTLFQRIGGDEVAAETMMSIMDSDRDGVVSWHEFWGYTVVMQEGHSDEKVQMMLRGGDVAGDNHLSRNELSDLTASVYLGALAVRGKTYGMSLLEAAHVDLIDGQRLLPDGIEQSLDLLSQPADDWVNPITQKKTSVALLRSSPKEATLQEFAEVVGDVAANYAFVAANKEGDRLNITELENWVDSGHPSFQFLRQLFMSTQTHSFKERNELINYLKEHHNVIEGVTDTSMLGLLQQEVRDTLA
jgi:Ca2+-binding EF-hand superfamily protein